MNLYDNVFETEKEVNMYQYLVYVNCPINFYITIMLSILYYTIDIPSILELISTTSSSGQVTLEVHTRSPGDKLPSSSLLI